MEKKSYVLYTPECMSESEKATLLVNIETKLTRVYREGNVCVIMIPEKCAFQQVP